jgi:ubiquinone/menaquinone biosynthesis C-methylase UbiE
MKTQESTRIIRKNKICYILDDNGKIKKFKPWLGDIFSFLYDSIMEKSVFPGKFKGSYAKHFDILKQQYQDIRGKKIIEIATGSGSTAYLLNKDNSYTGVDISRGLLVRAVKKFEKNNFSDAQFFVADACDLPFKDELFDVAICDLSLNFLGNIEYFLKEIIRVLKKDSVFYCSVPVPERANPKSAIHGNLYSENELKTLFEKSNFRFVPEPYKNGAVFYFAARLYAGE